MSDDSDLDHRALIAEIYDDLRNRRESGEITASLEDEVDAAFARVAPVAAFGGDARVLIERAEDAASIDPHVPVESGSPATTVVKRVLRKSMFWYVAWITNQVGQFAGSLSRAVRLVEDRLSDVEAGQLRTPRTDAELARIEPRELEEAASELVISHLASCRGPVLVAEAATGRLVGRLRAEGLDTDGVEPRADLVARAAGDGVRLAMATARDRLRSLRPAGLDGLVLLGATDRSTPEQHLELADLAAVTVGPGGRVAIIATSPAVIAAEGPPIHIDLSTGRPLAASTWRHILETRGFDEVVVADLTTSYCITAVRAEG